jgi:hypothetical protein
VVGTPSFSSKEITAFIAPDIIVIGVLSIEIEVGVLMVRKF